MGSKAWLIFWHLSTTPAKLEPFDRSSEDSRTAALLHDLALKFSVLFGKLRIMSVSPAVIFSPVADSR